MASLLLTNGTKSICVVKHIRPSSYLVYKLKRTEKHGFKFYGVSHRFKLALNQNLPLSKQPYGLIGSCIDISGRMMGAISGKREAVICSSGKKITFLESPVYHLIGKYSKSELLKFLEDYSLEQQDFPYASISISCMAVADEGDDLYSNTLFFMASGYGILTEISVVAGRALEDCCSPEYHYSAHKVKLDGTNLLKRIQANDMVSGAVPVEWTVSVNPEAIAPIRVKFNDSSKQISDFDKLINQLFITLMPSSLRNV